jgi:hypothetical protein
MARARRRRADEVATFILLGSDGRHVLLGRQAAPEDAEVGQIGALLASMGQGGWVVRMAGDYWNRKRPVCLEMIREAAPSPVQFETAAAGFEKRRQGAFEP